jgi:hypothetical protein
MADTLALEKLFNDVEALFIAEGTNVPNLFGWRIPAQQVIGPRIAWVPGNFGGNAGEDAPARNPGRNPRSLGTFRELFHVVISSEDPTAPEDELAQWKSTRLVFDAWYRAVYLSAHGTYRVLAIEWVTDKMERRFGAALRVTCAIESMVPDEALAVAPVDTVAVITASELDVTDTAQTISADDVP